MTKQNFWKGLIMLVVSIALTAFNQVPLDWALLFVAGISSLLGYIGKNLIFVVDTVSTWAKIVSGLLVAVGVGITEAVGLIAVEGKILWVVLLKVVGGVFLTYITATFLSPPAAQSKQIRKLSI